MVDASGWPGSGRVNRDRSVQRIQLVRVGHHPRHHPGTALPVIITRKQRPLGRLGFEAAHVVSSGVFEAS